MFEEGARLLERAAQDESRGEDAPALFRDTAAALRDGGTDAGTRWGIVTEGRVADVDRARADREPHDLRPDPHAARRAAARGLRLLVRVLPALRGRRAPRRRLLDLRHVPHRGPAAARDRRDGLRRRLHPAGEPDRHDEPQGPEQHPRRRAERPGLPLRHRLGGGRPRRDPPRPRHRAGLPRLPRRGEAAAPRDRARHRAAGLPRPPLGDARTPSSSRRSRTARSPTPRTRRRSTRTSTR